MSIKILGEIRKFAAQSFGSAEKILRMSQHESQVVCLSEPDGWEMSRAGRRFYGGAQNGSTGRAPVQAIPTTAFAWMLWNGEADGGAAYAIDQITVFQLSGTAAVGGVILCALSNEKHASPTAATGYAVSSASKSSRGSKARWADNGTFAATPTWMALLGNGNPATTTNGGATHENRGRIVIPPGFGLGIHYLSGTGTTPLYLASAIWTELESAQLE